MGLSPLAAREVCHRAGLEPQAQTVNADQARALLDATAGLAAAVREGPLSATIYRDPSGDPMAATPVPFAHLEACSKAEPMPSANAAAAAFAEARTETQRAVHLRQRLASAVDQALKKVTRALQINAYHAPRRELAAAIAIEAGQLQIARRHIEALTLIEPDRPQHHNPLEAIDRMIQER